MGRKGIERMAKGKWSGTVKSFSTMTYVIHGRAKRATLAGNETGVNEWVLAFVVIM